MVSEWILDAGHGGTDPGAIGINGQKEKEWTWEAQTYIDRRLQDCGIPSICTRHSDETIDPDERTRIVREADRDKGLSLHFNKFNKQANGFEFIHSKYANGEFEHILKEEFLDVGLIDFRRIFDKVNSYGNDWYYMHRETGRTRFTIVEFGFLDNPNDYNVLKHKENRERYYEACVRAICRDEKVEYAPTTKQDNSHLYRVQIGAFSKKDNADELAEQLRKQGYDTYIK